MTAQVVVVTGPARSGKTHELVREYRAALQRASVAGLNRVLWLAPSGRAATAVREHIIAAGALACLSPRVATFDGLARQILFDTKTKIQPVTAVLQRELLRRVLATALEAGELAFFADAAHRSGFVELLAEHIRELKRRDIRPEIYARITPRAGAQQHRELASLYSSYERQLTSHGLFDTESIHWAARDALANDAARRFRELDLFVADGFTDFTHTQHEILTLLSARTRQLLISLPLESAPQPRRTGRFSDQSEPRLAHQSDQPPIAARGDLFAKVAATLAELQLYHPHLKIRELPARPSDWPALDHLAGHIFRHPKHVPPQSTEALDSLDRIEIIQAAGAQDEIVQIARRIKKLLTEKAAGQAKPGDIVVVFRSLVEAAPRVEEVFDRFGIPYSLETRTPIARSAVFKSLAALLRLDQEDWPFRRVVSIITNNALSALAAESRQAAEWLVRDLQIAGSRRKLLERITELAAEHGADADLSEHHAHRVAAAATALPALSQLAHAFDDLPKEATTTEWCAALERLGTDLGFTVPPADHDAAAWQAILAHFTALERLDAWLGRQPRKLSRRELIATLVDVATNESLPRPHDDVGRVRVLAAPAARFARARHLFLAGMSEQSFPSPERAGRLATEAEYRFLTNAAHQERFDHMAIVPHATRAQEEMLLFYEVLSRAEESLTISYPALDDKAQQLPPSPYVVDMMRMLAGQGENRIRCARPQLSPVPQSHTDERDTNSPDAVIGSLADCRVRAVAQAIQSDGDRGLLAGLVGCDETNAIGAAIDAGLRTVHARARGESFGPSEGLLTSPAVAARLAQDFGPQHLWSPSQWETYAACPFKFFLQAVLHLEPLGDLVLETDFTRRGSRLHHVLAAFHRGWPEVRGDRSLGPDEEAEKFLAHLQQVIHERIATTPRGGIDAALLELDRRQILKWAAHHFDHHVKYGTGCEKRGGPMTPSHFEFRFGPSRPGDTNADPQSTGKAFELDIGGEPIRITGQIDRIDVGTIGGKTVFNVIDYKSGRRPSLKSEQIITGQQLQLPIYVEAAQALVFDGNATPLAAGYWSMASGFDEKGALAVRQEGDHADRWRGTQVTVRQLIRNFVDAIRKGDFPVASRDERCTSFCEFSLVCRVAQARSLGKTWWPEPLAAPTND